MSATIVPFPNWQQTGQIASEADMISWAIKELCVEHKRYARKEAVQFGRLLWAEFQRRDQLA